MKGSTVIYLIAGLVLLASACKDTAESSQKAAETGSAAPFENIDVPDFQKKMQSADVSVLDVRTSAETQTGMIRGALNIDFMSPDFKEKIADLDKAKTYLVYCQSGGRSARACDMMAEMGFQSLYNLKPGYMGWPKE